jgi:anti-sigma-K factor RskA
LRRRRENLANTIESLERRLASLLQQTESAHPDLARRNRIESR